MALSNILQTVREDDFIEYYLFPLIDTANEEADLLNYVSKINNIVDRYSNGYLWHKDKFNTIARPLSSNILSSEEIQTDERLPSHIYGIMHYGDNIEDEWFVVFLLLQLTKEIDNLVVRVIDSDGEFLLIEAANFLPPWANPETCEKRVYLYKGQIHLVPVNQQSNDDITVQDAIDIIYREPLLTEASTNIQSAIFSRISKFSENMDKLLHNVKVYLPIGVATILNHKPELISPAILAFCNRDTIDLKYCRAMKFFPPENRVYTPVKFTRCLYAMLTHSKFLPDRKTGWNLPELNNPHFKSHILGIKIACGFEILAAGSKNDTFENEQAWKLYLKSLEDKNYFQNFLEHSQEHNNLLNNAKKFYKEQKKFSTNSSDIGRAILELNRKLDHNVEEFKLRESNIPEDDDESWLEISAKELDKMLEERYGHNNVISFNNESNASNFSGKLTEFLDNVSSLEGAEFPDKNPPIRPKRGVKCQKNKIQFAPDIKPSPQACTANNETKINFDPLNFSCAVQNILDLVIPEDSWDLESGSEMSEYGSESESELDKIDSKKINSKIKQYMEEMDRELAGTTIGKSFEKKSAVVDTFDDIESFTPVDIDMTALKNILESYQSQMGESGPASNMLGPMGVHLEPSTSQK